MVVNKKVFEVSIAREHISKEEELSEFFYERGYACLDIAYHHLLSASDCGKLKKADTPASIAYRTNADFIICKSGESSYVELKVGRNKNRCYIEAYPLALHRLKTSLGVPCLYVYGGEITEGNMVACPAEDIIVEKLVIPKRNKDIQEYLLSAFNCPVEYKEVMKGMSGDAFVIVTKEEIFKWRPLCEFFT